MSTPHELLSKFLEEDLGFTRSLPTGYSLVLSSEEQGEPVELHERQLIVRFNRLSDQQKKTLQGLFKEIQEQGKTFISQERTKILLKFKDVAPTQKLSSDFLKLTTTPGDSECFKVGVFLQMACADHFKAGICTKEDFHSERSRISAKYGDRGAKILKICTAGYLDTYILPLFSMYEESKISVAFFKEQYDLIIKEEAFSIFVNGYMGVKDIVEKIEKKMKTNREYGIPLLNIHGIGENNIRNIQSALEEKDPEKNGYERKTFRQEDKVFVARYELESA